MTSLVLMVEERRRFVGLPSGGVNTLFCVSIHIGLLKWYNELASSLWHTYIHYTLNEQPKLKIELFMHKDVHTHYERNSQYLYVVCMYCNKTIVRCVCVCVGGGGGDSHRVYYHH